VRTEAVLNYERKRDVPTLDKSFKKILQGMSSEYHKPPPNAGKTYQSYVYEVEEKKMPPQQHQLKNVMLKN